METFKITDLSFSYPEQAKRALDGLCLTVRKGEFLTVCGQSGSGKSTLLRQLKTVLAPHGTREGEILFEGAPLDGADRRAQSAKIGFVLQNPDAQIVTDKVWHELAFGLESLGCDTPTIRSRVTEMASFFGIESWFYRDVAELSGGQRQLLNLASIMAMQPSVLILDEPTSQLDPIAASEFLSTIGRINSELGTTVILTEHRLEEVFPLSTRVAVMDSGKIICEGGANEIGRSLRESGHSMFEAMPAPMRIWAAVQNALPCPVTVRDGRNWLEEYGKTEHIKTDIALVPAREHGARAVTLEDVWFRYEKELPDVLRGLSLTAHRGELLAILGGNGVGKTTSLSIIAGLRRAHRGKCETVGRVATLPQNPQALFVKKTVREDLFEILKGSVLPDSEKSAKVSRAVTLCRLEDLLDRHPFDLSGGEQQRAALAKTLLLDPEILLLDEPTKGLDAQYKQVLAQILQTLCCRGVAIILVSHDVEFCAKYAHRCAMFFDGGIVSEGEPRRFFSGKSFYTTAANRMARGLIPGAVTAEDVILACGGQVPPETVLPDDDAPLPPPEPNSLDAKPARLPLWRRIVAGISGTVAAATFIIAIAAPNLSTLLTDGGITAAGYASLPSYVAFILAAFTFSLAIGRRAPPPIASIQVPREKRKLSKRTIAAAIVSLLLIPLTIFIGYYYLGGRKYYFIFLLVMLEAMLPFVMIFEGRSPQARELVIIAVLCTIGVAARTAFFALPNFSPTMAVIIISGVALGGEAGFLVGATTMMLSNIMISQGPWSPFQMFAMGLVGFLAGILFRKGLLRRTRGSLCAFGAVSAVVIYGGIMNPSAALIWARSLNAELLLSYYIAGFPMDIVHAAATAIFLFFGAEPMLEKLDRVKVKYGLIRHGDKLE